MRLLVATHSMNCHLALYQSCIKYNIECIRYEEGLAQIKDTDVIIYLEANPFNVYRDLKCTVINRDYFDGDKTNKYIQYLIIKKSGVNYIPTYTHDEIQNIPIDIFVSKPSKGSMGNGVELLFSKNNLLKSNIYQPLIRNDGDWRVVVINGKAVSMIKRKGLGFLNNLAQGAVGWSDWNNEAAKLAEESAKALNIEFAGIDIMQCLDTGKYYFLECNSTTTFDTSQILTRIDIAEELVNYIVKTYEK
jgi:glutathione synthase/RimK-type ligase-like ATP-grasp enzyme